MNLSRNYLKALLPVLLTYFIDNFGLAIAFPVFTPLFLSSDLGMFAGDVTTLQRTALLGLTISIFPLLQFFGAPFFGHLSDRIGRKKVLICTLLGGALGYALTGLAIEWRVFNLLLFSRAWTGFFAGNLTLCLAAATDFSTSDNDRAKNFGLIAAMGGLGFLAAIFLGKFTFGEEGGMEVSLAVPFFITCILALINWAVIVWGFKEHMELKHTDEPIFPFKGLKHIINPLKSKSTKRLYGIYFLFIFSWIIAMQYASAFLFKNSDISEPQLLTLFMSIGAIWFFINLLLNPLLTYIFRPRKIFMVGLFFMALAFFFLPLSTTITIFFALFFAATLCAALNWTNGLAAISLNASEKAQGATLGINQSLCALATIIAPLLGGVLIGQEADWLYPVAGICALIGALLLHFPASKRS